MRIKKDPILGTWEMAESDKAASVRSVSPDVVPCDFGRILIVDDEPGVRGVLRRILLLELPDYILSMAGNGQEAFDLFCQEHHGVILMDLSMPVMNGEQAFHNIMEHCLSVKWQRPAVVFCTGYDPSGSVRNIVADEPMHCMLRKPVSNKTLADAIKARL